MEHDEDEGPSTPNAFVPGSAVKVLADDDSFYPLPEGTMGIVIQSDGMLTEIVFMRDGWSNAKWMWTRELAAMTNEEVAA